MTMLKENLIAALAVEGASPGTQVIAAEPEGWDDTARSLAAGERLAADGKGSTFCDALLSIRPGEITFALNRMDVGGYRHVPVLQDSRVIGVVSSRDVLGYVLQHEREQVATQGVTTSHGVRKSQ